MMFLLLRHINTRKCHYENSIGYVCERMLKTYRVRIVPWDVVHMGIHKYKAAAKSWLI